MTRDERIKQLQAMSEEGLTLKEAAEREGRPIKTTAEFAKAYGIQFRDGRALPGLTREQARDVTTLIRLGRYTQDEAIRIATRPKTKVRAFPKEARA